jgi:hypothetical protein
MFHGQLTHHGLWQLVLSCHSQLCLFLGSTAAQQHARHTLVASVVIQALLQDLQHLVRHISGRN